MLLIVAPCPGVSLFNISQPIPDCQDFPSFSVPHSLPRSHRLASIPTSAWSAPSRSYRSSRSSRSPNDCGGASKIKPVDWSIAELKRALNFVGDGHEGVLWVPCYMEKGFTSWFHQNGMTRWVALLHGQVIIRRLGASHDSCTLSWQDHGHGQVPGLGAACRWPRRFRWF